ncbi:MAG: hypothetical protein AAGH72_08600 [Verrucomicrobiota bacterium]
MMRNLFKAYQPKTTLESRRRILSRSSRAGNPVNAIRNRIQQASAASNRSFFTLKIDDWSNYKSWGLLGLAMFGLLSGGWFNPWTGTIDGAYQPAQVADGYEIVIVAGFASARG